MLEGLPIMLALCFMLWHAYYAQNYAGIIDAGLGAYQTGCRNKPQVMQTDEE